MILPATPLSLMIYRTFSQLRIIGGLQEDEEEGKDPHLGSGLFSHQDDISGCIVDGNVGDEETPAGQSFQAVHEWGGQEEEAIRLGAVEHLTFELQSLNGKKEEEEEVNKRSFLCVICLLVQKSVTLIAYL